ncbi:MAG: ATP-binding protein [Cyanobacteria bacterium P01_H01_bin.58]
MLNFTALTAALWVDGWQNRDACDKRPLIVLVLMPSSHHVRWYNSLWLQSVLVFGSIVGWLALAIALAMNTFGKQVVSAQAQQSMEQVGNNAVAELSGRLKEITALTRAIAATTRELPSEELLFRRTIPNILDADGEFEVAGGGFWSEPFQFERSRDRAGFFWGRREDGNLNYYEDYNQPDMDYHNQAWYVTAHHTAPGVCAWSEAYLESFSLEPVVTCTVGVDRLDKLKGAATVDLKVDSLQSWAAEWQDGVGGYLFMVDRNNRFITFPKTDLVREQSEGEDALTGNYILVEEFAETAKSFGPISRILDDINQRVVEQAKVLPNYDSDLADDLEGASNQIDAEGAELLAATLLDPFEREPTSNHLLGKVTVRQDPLLKVRATAFVFHVPDTYWKIVIVKPNAAIFAPANRVMEWLLFCVLGATAIAAPVGYWGLKRWLLDPLADTTAEVNTMASAIATQDWQVITEAADTPTERNEIGLLRRVFRTMAQTTADKSQQLQAKNRELRNSLKQLTEAQSQLVQAEKMSSLGQLIAGVAHEINNPVSFISGNLNHAQTYAKDLLLLAEKVEAGIEPEALATLMEEMDFEFVQADLPNILKSMETGTLRIQEIVMSLRTFSRLDEAAFKAVDIHPGIDSTLTILGHRTKAGPTHPGIQVIKDYGELPLVECYAGPLNQVFMNLLSNALDALEERDQKRSSRDRVNKPSRIEIRTEAVEGDRVRIHIADNGPGMPPEVQQKVFEYLYTTKPVGKGTGLGLTISRDIVEGKHKGKLSVVSMPEEGTTFTIELPVYFANTSKPEPEAIADQPVVPEPISQS